LLQDHNFVQKREVFKTHTILGAEVHVSWILNKMQKLSSHEENFGAKA
jgi:hypothetical protein